MMRAFTISLLILCASAAFAGRINVSSSSALNAANEDAVPGDTVALAAGTYTVGIVPTNSGTAGSPIVYMPATPGAVCSLSVSGGDLVVDLASKNYIIIQDLRLSKPPYSAGRVVYFNVTSDCLLQRCRIYGASSYTNGNIYGNWITAEFSDCVNLRVLKCFLDRRDASIPHDSLRGQGFEVNGTSTRNVIFEEDTAISVSHYAFSLPQGTGSSNCYVIMRNCVAYDNHCGGGNNGTNQRYLYEGNRFFRTGMVNTYKDGQSVEIIGSYGIIRYNYFYEDGPASTTTMGETVNNLFLSDVGNRTVGNMVYGNAFMGNSLNNKLVHAISFYNSANDTQFGQNLKNNIIAYPNSYSGVTAYFWQNQMTGFQAMDTVGSNCLWTHAAGDNVAWLNNGSDHKYTLAAMKSTFSTLWNSGNIECTPGWLDSTTTGINRNFALHSSSHLIDAGEALTVVASNVSSSTLVTVGNANYFHYDWGPYDRGDSVMIGTNRCELDSVDYTNRRLILKSAISVSAGASVHVLATYSTVSGTYTTRLVGSAPDIGPSEYDAGGSSLSAPGTVANAEPIDSALVAQPVTFKWHPVAGATQYWLTASYDNWAHDHVSVQQADTSYTFSGFPADTAVIWNVSAGNSAGWGPWSDVWMFRTQANITYTDTVVVNWNNIIESETLSGNTVLTMSNLQRRDNILVIKNPAGRVIDWPYEIRWPGRTIAPQPTAGDTTAYWLIRDGAVVYGFELGSQSSSTVGVTAGWVLSQLTRKQDIDPTGGVSAGTHYSYFRAGSQWTDNAVRSARYQEVLTPQDRTLPVVFIGDSRTNQIRPFVMRRIKEQWGFGGLGFDAFGNSGYNGWQSYQLQSASWVTYSRNASDEKWGISGTSLRGFTGDTLLYLPMTGYRTHTDARLWFLKKSGGGTFKLHVDGGAGISINTNSTPTRLAAYRISGLDANTNHYFKIDSISVDSVTIYGIETFNSAAHGVAPYFLSVGGSTADEWASHMSFFRAFYDSIGPVLTNVWLGANDAIAGYTSPAYTSDITRILDTLKAIDTTGVVLWTDPAKGNNPIDGNPDAAYWSLTGEYRDSLISLQSSRGVSVWDVRSYMPSYVEGVRLNLYSDYIHYSFRGSNYLAQGLMQWLLPTDRRFYGLNRDNSDKWRFGEGSRTDSTVDINGTLGVSGSVGVAGRILANYYMHGGLAADPDYMSAALRLAPYSSGSPAYSYLEARDDNELIDRNFIIRTQDGLGAGAGVSIKEFQFFSSGSMTIPGTMSANAFSATGAVLSGTNMQIGTDLYVKGSTNIRNKANSGWLTWASRSTANTEASINLDYLSSVTLRTNTGSTKIDSAKVGTDSLFIYIGGTAYGMRKR